MKKRALTIMAVLLPLLTAYSQLAVDAGPVVLYHATQAQIDADTAPVAGTDVAYHLLAVSDKAGQLAIRDTDLTWNMVGGPPVPGMFYAICETNTLVNGTNLVSAISDAKNYYDAKTLTYENASSVQVFAGIYDVEATTLTFTKRGMGLIGVPRTLKGNSFIGNAYNNAYSPTKIVSSLSPGVTISERTYFANIHFGCDISISSLQPVVFENCAIAEDIDITGTASFINCVFLGVVTISGDNTVFDKCSFSPTSSIVSGDGVKNISFTDCNIDYTGAFSWETMAYGESRMTNWQFIGCRIRGQNAFQDAGVYPAIVSCLIKDCIFYASTEDWFPNVRGGGASTGVIMNCTGIPNIMSSTTSRIVGCLDDANAIFADQ